MSRRGDKRTVLPSQQRRLRHLKAIVVRNLTWKPEHGLPNLYYALHEDMGTRAFYVSETVASTVNPAWRPFDLTLVPSRHLRALSQFVLRVFAAPDDASRPHRLLLEWTVDLYGLEYYGLELSELGDVTPPTAPSPAPAAAPSSSSSAVAAVAPVGKEAPMPNGAYPPDTVLFELADGFYGPPMSSVEFAITSIEQEIKASMVKVERSRVRRMYGLDHVQRINSLEREHFARAVETAEARRAIQRALNTPERREAPECAQTSIRLAYLKKEIEAQKALRDEDIARRDALATANADRRRHLATLSAELVEAMRALGEAGAELAAKKDVLRKTHALLMLRRSQLIAQLSAIYPIELLNKQSNVYSISNMRLPNSDYAGHDEELIATSLGHVAHLVFMIAKYLEMPLRFPLVPMSSRSFIFDGISLPQPAMYPLYSKGADRVRFDTGVFLLNKNIEQLLNFCGILASDLRLTLPNLKLLLHTETKAPERPSIVVAMGASGGKEAAPDTKPQSVDPNGVAVTLPAILQAPAQ